MVISIVRDGEQLDLDEPHLRALVTAVLDAQRAGYGRLFHAQREDRLEQAQQHLTHLARLQRLADFLVGRTGE